MATRKKKQIRTEQSIAEDTSVPKSIRRILAMCPKQELRPVRLTQWAEELVSESRRAGISNRQIQNWIEEYAKANYWSDGQISAVLTDNGLKSSGSGGGSGGGDGGPTFRIEDIQELLESLTGLDESELIRAERREDLERKSRSHILETQIRLSEFEINHWIAQFGKLATVTDIYSDTLRRRKAELKRSVITE
jgi:hypothetical protein